MCYTILLSSFYEEALQRDDTMPTPREVGEHTGFVLIAVPRPKSPARPSTRVMVSIITR